MAQELLIIGASGTGKSTSMENLNPEETFIINVAKKPLPFKGWKSKYTTVSKENPKGNYLISDDVNVIIKTLKYIDSDRPEIKNIVIDDYQYVMANEYMRRANENGFKKFTEIAQSAWLLVETAKSMREDVTIAFVNHPEEFLDANGNKQVKAKTLGKMIDNVITLEGMFSIVLYTDVKKTDKGMDYGFLTQTDGTNTGKSPRGMFEEEKVPNDLNYVIEKIHEYNG
jgi:hypothetical protein